jgi:hypothetical protein
VDGRLYELGDGCRADQLYGKGGFLAKIRRLTEITRFAALKWPLPPGQKEKLE